jgi:hypothetical protein
MGFACIHVARAIDTGESAGFFWCDDPEMDRPWAWCASCEARFVETSSDWKELGRVADFKLLCAECWDEAKRVLFGAG